MPKVPYQAQRGGGRDWPVAPGGDRVCGPGVLPEVREWRALWRGGGVAMVPRVEGGSFFCFSIIQNQLFNPLGRTSQVEAKIKSKE